MINIQNTIHRGYIVLNQTSNSFYTENSKLVLNIISKLEKRNYILSSNLVTALFSTDKSILEEIKNDIKTNLTMPKGKFLRDKFATSEDLTKEDFDFEDLAQQMYIYFTCYSLGEIPKQFKSIKRDTNEDKGIELSENIKFVEFKSINDFQKDLRDTVYMPIVFGEEQINLLKNAFENDILLDVLDSKIKVKENLFNILNIIGKENIRSLDLFSTSNDILRYALFVSEQDWKNIALLEKESKFKLSTSDKKVIMDALNKMSLSFAFNDMYPNKSLWKKVAINLNPGSKKFDKYPNAQKLFYFIRNGGHEKEIGKTFNQITQELIENKEFVSLFEHFSKNKGLILRNIDMIIRNSNKEEVLKIAERMKELNLNPKLIMEVRGYLKYRGENDINHRIFNVKGKLISIDDKPLKKLKKKKVSTIIKSFDDIIMKSLTGKKLFKIQSEEA